MSNQQIQQLKAISHPLRMEILRELFRRVQPTPIKEIADLLQEAPAKLHYHFKQLETAGLIQVAETREINGITERFYVPTGEDTELTLSLRDNPEAVSAAVPVMERKLSEMVRRLGHLTNEVIGDQEPCVYGIIREMNLSPAEAKAWRECLMAISKGEEAPVPQYNDQGAEKYDLAILFVPRIKKAP